MTVNYPTAPTPPRRGESLPPVSAEEQGTADLVKDQAADLSHSSIQAGKHAADVAREEASGVAAEVGRQGSALLRQAQEQLGEQAAQGQQRLAAELLSLGDQLNSMADGSSRGGMAVQLARQAASRARDAGQWLDGRKPAQVMDEVQSFARRRPGVFLALAAGAGLAAGRLTRGLKAAANDDPASVATSAPQATAEHGWEGAQLTGQGGYQPASAEGVSEEIPDLSAPAGGLPPIGGESTLDAGSEYGERASLVTDDQAGRGGTQ